MKHLWFQEKQQRGGDSQQDLCKGWQVRNGVTCHLTHCSVYVTKSCFNSLDTTSVQCVILQYTYGDCATLGTYTLRGGPTSAYIELGLKWLRSGKCFQAKDRLLHIQHSI